MSFIDLRSDHRQSQTMSPRLQHAVRLLQMSSLDFAAMVRDTLCSNPFLETEDGDVGDGAAYDDMPQPQASLADTDFNIDRDAELRREGQEQGDGDDGDHGDMSDTGDASDRDLWQSESGVGSDSGVGGGDDGELSALDMMAVETSLNTHLHGQLNVLPRHLPLCHLRAEIMQRLNVLRRVQTPVAVDLPGVQTRAEFLRQPLVLQHHVVAQKTEERRSV